MKHRAIYYLILVLLTCGTLATEALAENRAGAFSISPMAGAYIFEGSQELDDEAVLALALGYNFTENWALEALFSYVDTETTIGAEHDAEVTALRLGGLYHFRPTEDLVPYLAFGLGAGRTDIDNPAGNDDVYPAVDYGLGLKYFLSENLALRLDARHILNFEVKDSRWENDDFQNFSAMAGLNFLLGGEVPAPPAPADEDGDGVIDGLDECPDTPAGVDVDAKGCPLDTDGDGVLDHLDKCPGTPAGVKVDSEGCTPDTDGDGVLNHLDKCPGTPAGVAVNALGCPPDTDGDGVLDHLDKCPGTPAGVAVDSQGCAPDTDGDGVPYHLDSCPNTPAGVKVDSKGCPLDTDGDGILDHLDNCPESPAGVPVNAEGCPQSLTLHIEFDLGKAYIKPRFKDQLKEAAEFIKVHPGQQILVAGHTDSVGPEPYNMTLSQSRSESVRQYLINNFDISPSRITSKGYGESQPMADNSTVEGRQLNRRVEVVCCAILPE